MTRPCELPDERLCSMAAAGDRQAEECLVTRYNRLVRACSRPYFLAGGDSEDLLQEGMIGLLSAIRGFSPTKEVLFSTYAETCIRNRLRSAVRAAARDKHSPLNRSVPLDATLFDKESKPYLYGADRHQTENPEDFLIDREEYQNRIQALKGLLSAFERKVLEFYLEGISYGDIADKLGKSPKAVDNAVQRIRRKSALFFSSGDISAS